MDVHAATVTPACFDSRALTKQVRQPHPYLGHGVCLSYAVKELFSPFKERAVKRAERLFSVVSLAVIYGTAGKRTVSVPPVSFVTQTSWALMDGWRALQNSQIELARTIRNCWDQRASGGEPLVVLTGGEPGLQVDGSLLRELKLEGFETAVETNGTLALPRGSIG